MEFLTILLSSLLGVLSVPGVVIDQVAQKELRSQFAAVEQLQVRIDNTPNYQVLRGTIDRVRVAGRGLFPIQDVRLEALEVETDSIYVNANSIRRGKLQLQKPLQAAVRMVLKSDDVNRALRSPTVTNRLRNLGATVLSDQDAKQLQRYELLNPRVEFLANQRFRLQVALREPGDPATLEIMAEAGVELLPGQRVQLIAPVVQVNGEAVPDRVVTAIAEGIAERSSLSQFEQSGITVRVLQWRITPTQVDMAMFVQVAVGK